MAAAVVSPALPALQKHRRKALGRQKRRPLLIHYQLPDQNFQSFKMSLMPFMADDLDDYFYRRLRALDRMVTEDFCPFLRGRHLPPRRHSHYDSGALTKADKNTFQVSLDVQQFAPEELTVKIVNDNSVVVEGKHEEREDEHGFVSRHFVRRYTLPKGHSAKDVQSSLSSDGILTISAKKRERDTGDVREVPITLTGPSKKILTNGVEQNKEDGAANDESCEPKAKKSKI